MVGGWGNKHLVSFPQSKFSHFLTKTSWVGETIPSYLQELGWNFRSVCLLLGHIQPVAIENAARSAALCCEEIAFPACSWFRIRPLLPLQITSASQTPTNHCLITHCGFGGRILLPTVDWARQERPRTEQHTTRNGSNIKQWSRNQKAQKGWNLLSSVGIKHFCSTFSQPLVKLSSNLPEKSKESSKQSWRHRLPLRISFSLTQTYSNISCWKDKMCLLLSWGTAKRYSSEQTELQSASSQLLSNAPDSLFNYRDTARTMRAWPRRFHYWAVWGKKI